MVEIIAECGINHNGDFDRAMDMVAAAYESGADTAKFQYYDPEVLLDKKHPELKDCWDVIVNSKLTREQIEELKGETESYGMSFLVSVFTPEDVRWLDSIGIERFKIASRSIYDGKLATAIYNTGKPVLVSYGYYEKDWAPLIWIKHLKGGILVGKPDISKLYCVSKYPAKISDIDFYDGGKESLFGQGVFQGYSDHTIGTSVAMVAIVLGARIIEKHFTLDKNLPGPDHLCSAGVKELQRLCDYRRDVNEVLR